VFFSRYTGVCYLEIESLSPLVLVKTLTMSDYSKWDHIQVSSHGRKHGIDEIT